MHTETDSDATTTPASFPTRSLQRHSGHGQVYYVQSPQDSHDGDQKATNSFHSSPTVLSPVASPDPRSQFSAGSMKPAGSGKGGDGGRKKDHGLDAIEEEEGLLGPEDKDAMTVRRRWYCIGFIAAFLLLFSFFSLVLWGVGRNQKPIVSMKSVKFEVFDVQAGTNFNGVATALASMNATVKLVYRNRGPFFGVHVTSTPLQLYYQSLSIASGHIKNFYERRKSEKSITVRLMGDSIPLYGGGVNLNTKNGAPISPVPLTLSFRVRSGAYVLGKLVKPKFYKTITCSLVMDPQKMNKAISLGNLCTYQ